MIFNSQPRITQFFGANPEFYGRFGLFGHEGLDMVPSGKDRTVFSWMEGAVKRVYFSEVYGNTLIIYEPVRSLSWRLAHLASVNVKEGDAVSFDEPAGVMGDTPSGREGIGGRRMAAHLHVNCIPMRSWTQDPNLRDFPRNGFKGRVDPLGVLRERGEL